MQNEKEAVSKVLNTSRLDWTELPADMHLQTKPTEHRCISLANPSENELDRQAP